MATSGFFITLEGGEGSGKSTQIKAIEVYLKAKGREVYITREPGGDVNAEAIRTLVLNGAANRWDPVSETLLFQAARVGHVNNLIQPALEAGKVVISDRFTDSTLVYQGICKKLGTEWVEKLFALTLPYIKPHLTLLLDIDPKAGLARTEARKGGETRFESMGLAFHQQVRDGFLALAKREPSRIKTVDASASADVVSKEICAIIDSHLKG